MNDDVSQLFQLELPSAEFKEALRSLARSMPRTQRAVSLWFEDGKLFIDADPAGVRVPARGEWFATTIVAASWVRRLAKRMPTRNPIRLRAADGKLYVNRFSEPCSLSFVRHHRDPEPPNTDVISKAAIILEPLLIRREEVEQAVASARARGTVVWSEQERPVMTIIGQAWALLAPLGVETNDLRRLVDDANRDAWKRAERRK